MKKYYIWFVLLLMVNTALSQINHSFAFQATDFSISTDQENYAHLKGQNFDSFLEQEGAPKLPVILRSFVLPMGSTVTGITTNNTNTVLINNNAYIYPAQPDVEFDSIPEFVPPATVIYGFNNPFPAQTVSKRSDSFTFGYHIVTLEICPFKYIPNEKKIYFYQNIDISIQYTIGETEQTQSITRFRENLSKEMVKSMVSNPELIDGMDATAEVLFEESNTTDKLWIHWLPMGAIPDYLIITNEELKSVFQELADYKTKRGFPSLVLR